jgi:hypothetical protein
MGGGGEEHRCECGTGAEALEVELRELLASMQGAIDKLAQGLRPPAREDAAGLGRDPRRQ